MFDELSHKNQNWKFFLVPPEVTTTTTTLSPRTTRKPDRSTNSRQQNQTVPACVLAIVNCCSKYDDVVRTPCFEKHQCNGAFFGRSPCSPDIKSAAFREVEKFSQWWHFYTSAKPFIFKFSVFLFLHQRFLIPPSKRYKMQIPYYSLMLCSLTRNKKKVGANFGNECK